MFQELYEKGEYQKALEALQGTPEALASTPENPSASPLYFYRLGITHHALNHDALAVAYLERARSLSPQDPQIAQALDVSRQGLVRTLGETRMDPGSTLVQGWAEEFPFDQAAVLAGALGATLFAIQLGRFVVGRKSPRDWFRSRLSWVAISVVTLAVALGVLDFRGNSEPAAMVLESKVVKSGPGQDYLDLGEVEAGMKVRITDSERRQGWVKVRFSEGREGFVPGSILLLLANGWHTSEP